MKGTTPVKHVSPLRSLALLLSAVCLLALAGCSSKNHAVGVYDLTTILRDGATLEVDQLPQDSGAFSVTLDLKEDGTFSLDQSAPDGSSSMTGVWEEQGGKILLTSGSNTLSAAWEDGVLTLEQDSQTLTFQQRTEA